MSVRLESEYYLNWSALFSLPNCNVNFEAEVFYLNESSELQNFVTVPLLDDDHGTESALEMIRFVLLFPEEGDGTRVFMRPADAFIFSSDQALLEEGGFRRLSTPAYFSLVDAQHAAAAGSLPAGLASIANLSLLQLTQRFLRLGTPGKCFLRSSD